MENLSFIPKNLPAIIETTPDGPEWAIQHIVDPINRSLENDGDIIYNGNDEPFDVPTLGKTRDTFSSTWEDDQEITGFPSATKMVCIDIDRIKPEEQEETLSQYLDKKTVAVWRSCKIHKVGTFQFTEHSAAIHIDSVNDDGEAIWYEFILNKNE